MASSEDSPAEVSPPEAEVAPQAEVEAPVAAAVEAPEPQAEAPEAPVPAEKPPESDWKQARIAKQSARIRELASELERYKSAQPATDTVPAAEVEKLAEQRAQALATERHFNAQCDAVATAGQKQFPDFEAKVQQLIQLRDVNDPESMGAYRRFLEAVIETGSGPELIHRLGSAPDQAARVMGLSPVKMAVELAKMAQVKEAEATKAPKPISPLTGRGPSHEAIDPTDPDRADRLSTRQWMERRNAELAKRNSAA